MTVMAAVLPVHPGPAVVTVGAAVITGTGLTVTGVKAEIHPVSISFTVIL